jgi:hypothetical protein
MPSVVLRPNTPNVLEQKNIRPGTQLQTMCWVAF